MTSRDRTARIELEIMHVQQLLNEAHSLYLAGSPRRVALLCKEAEEFLGKFETDTTMDEHIEEKGLLMLGFLHLSAKKMVGEMKQQVAEAQGPGEFFERRERLRRFSREVHTPLTELLARRIVAYISRHGEEKFSALMFDNHLGDLADSIE